MYHYLSSQSRHRQTSRLVRCDVSLIRTGIYSSKNITIYMQEKQFAFIPWWIPPVLERNNLKTEDLLTYEKIRPYFSTEDLTSLAALSHVAHFFAGNGVGPDTVLWHYRWLDSVPSSDARAKSAIEDIAALASDEKVQDETLRRLVIEPSEVVPSPYGDAGFKETFEVSLAGDAAIAVKLKQGFTLVEHAKNQLALLRCMVKQLYVYEDYHALVSHSVGQAYVESLMH